MLCRVPVPGNDSGSEVPEQNVFPLYLYSI